MFWAPYGAYWRQARKLWHTELLSERLLKLHEHVRREEDTISAGTDTSAVTIEWTLSELLKNPVALTMATEELDRVVGRDRLPTEGDRLPYLQAVIKESMRMHPATPLLSPWRCRRDAVVGSYSIPAGTCVAVNVWAIGRDPSVWEEPNDF
ncbi:cytochrome P450 98A3-like [Panicum virgatum]|uniref:cytochrome P450 98A3-like n=1 Tax=Panicum virgatum TaxID=38727 RepID=UPI0019D595D9|nr:cytochrome P450 98A3-like [Panicum virgatum]